MRGGIAQDAKSSRQRESKPARSCSRPVAGAASGLLTAACYVQVFCAPSQRARAAPNQRAGGVPAGADRHPGGSLTTVTKKSAIWRITPRKRAKLTAVGRDAFGS